MVAYCFFYLPYRVKNTLAGGGRQKNTLERKEKQEEFGMHDDDVRDFGGLTLNGSIKYERGISSMEAKYELESAGGLIINTNSQISVSKGWAERGR